jgi:hypothetical protein
MAHEKREVSLPSIEPASPAPRAQEPARPPRAAERALLLVVLAAVLSAPAARAHELYTFTVAALGGIGGSTDAEPGGDLGNTGLQLNLELVTEPRTHLGVRLGWLDLDQDEGFEGLSGAELTYATIAGEYRYTHTFYQSGVYFGLGGYRLTGDVLGLPGAEEDETAVGVVLGLSGEFELTRRLAALFELAGHWTDLDRAQLFGTAHLGLAFHF